MPNRNRVFYVKSEKVNEYRQQIRNPILSYIKWHLLMHKCIGLLPFYSTVNFYEIGAPNRRWLLISRAIICVKIAFSLLHIYFLTTPSILEMFFQRSKTDGITTMLDSTFCMLSFVTISWSCACNTTKIMEIINRFMKVDQLLQQFSESHAELSYNKNLYNCYLLFTFGYLSFITFAYAMRFMSFISFNLFACVLCYLLENATSCAFIVLISSLLHLLAVRFQYINKLLAQYGSNILRKDKCLHSRLLPMKSFDKDLDVHKEVMLRLFAKNSKLIYALHNDLLDLFKMINSYAGLGLLAFFLYACYGVLTCIYACTLFNWQSENNIFRLLRALSWIPIFAGMSILLATKCDYATKEANKTAQVLARIYGKGKEYQNVIDKFLTQSIKQDVHFTAYGFFVIDNTTLFKIFSAVTSYLVILIQFKQLEECKAESEV